MSTLLSASISARYANPKLDEDILMNEQGGGAGLGVKHRMAQALKAGKGTSEEKSPAEKVAVEIGKLIPTETLLFLGAAAYTIPMIGGGPWQHFGLFASLVVGIAMMVTLTILPYSKDGKVDAKDWGEIRGGLIVSCLALYGWLVFTDNSVLQQALGWTEAGPLLPRLIALILSPVLLVLAALKAKE